jgi:cytosine/adenosine deaminase-related metal-dependent hydrolase
MSAETLAACVEVARASRAGVHIHVAEDAADERDAEIRFARRAVHRLAEAGALDDGTILAHCVHVDAAEIAAIRNAGAAVAHNARSNMNNSVGRAPVASFGDRVVLGTDGIGGDMFAESRAAYWRLREDEIAAPMAWPLQRLAEAARLAGRIFGEPALGHVTAGAPADVAILDYTPPTPLSDQTLIGHWVFGLSACHVRDVVVDGEVVVADRRLTLLDHDRIFADAAVHARRLWRRLEEIGPHTFQPAGVRSP